MVGARETVALGVVTIDGAAVTEETGETVALGVVTTLVDGAAVTKETGEMVALGVVNQVKPVSCLFYEQE